MLRLAVSSRAVVQRAMFHSASAAWKAEAFLMPAMSPTMEQGGIVEWKRKVGEEFSAGDVLLEVETDKATIEVEAQDDGKLAKIIMDNGAKNVKVGETIAFLADVEDNLDNLELPATTVAKTTPAKTKTSEAPVETKQKTKAHTGFVSGKVNSSQTFFPSVQTLLHENGISRDDALSKISATGPGGRILKGDVLGYLGKIPSDAAQSIASYVAKFQKLDLSNIEKRELTLEDNNAKTEVASEKVSHDSSSIKKEKVPVSLKDEIEFETPAHVTREELSLAIKAYMEQAKVEAHGHGEGNIHSELYDPIFEDLITQEPQNARFSYEYKLVDKDESATHVNRTNHPDIFDLLSTSANVKATDNVARLEGTHEYVLRVSVNVNENYTDSKAKAESFLDSIRDLAVFK